MRRKLQLSGGELAKLGAVAVTAALAGSVAGVGLSELRASDADPVPPTTSSPATPTTTASKGPPRQRKPRLRAAAVRVLDARLELASTESGRARNRARLVVRARITNVGATSRKYPRPYLVVDGRQVRSDRNADDAAAGLVKDVGSGRSVRGVLRFEISGEATEQLLQRQRAVVRLGSRTVRTFVRVAAASP